MEKIAHIIKTALTVLLTGGIIGGLAYGAHQYVLRINLFGLERIVISGSALVSNEEILTLARAPYGKSLFRIPPDSVQRRVATNPFINAVSVSRQFPRTLYIQVHEREPIAYINAGELLCMDRTGFIMPLPPEGPQLGIPILSGLNHTDSLIVGAPAPTTQIQKMVDILKGIRADYPGLYPQISELVSNEENEFILFTAENATRIYLGKDNLSRKIHLLEAFWSTVGTERSWKDYQYIDLRYRRQVIVREHT